VTSSHVSEDEARFAAVIAEDRPTRADVEKYVIYTPAHAREKRGLT
jgi:hypothetical protein